jgi:hypothetical protein
MSYLIVLFFLIVCDVTIPQKYRVPNENPGYCCWSSLETLGRFLHIRELYGIKESRKHAQPYAHKVNGLVAWYSPAHVGTAAAVKDQLDKLGVKYDLQYEGNYDKSLIHKSVDNGLGCVIGVHHGYPTCDGPHALVCTGLDDHRFTYVDTNAVEVHHYQGTVGWFDQEWSGLTVVVYPTVRVKP